MIYKITFQLDSSKANLNELEDIFDEYDIQYEINEVSNED